MAFLMMASAADAIFWQCSAERQDLIRELRMSVSDLADARLETDRLENEVEMLRFMNAKLVSERDQLSDELLWTETVVEVEALRIGEILE